MFPSSPPGNFLRSKELSVRLKTTPFRTQQSYLEGLVIQPRKTPITKDDFDLTVDYDSDVEDELGTDLLGADKDLNEHIGDCIEPLGYADNPSEFWSYYNKAAVHPMEQAIRIHTLETYGEEYWLEDFFLGKEIPLEQLFYTLGVLLTRDQRKLDDKGLFPLLKAAAFRVIRRRLPTLRTWSKKSSLLRKVVDRINNSRNIIVLSGAGISVSCGIPDFRSQDGLYTQLTSSGMYDLDDPQQMFDINYFKQDPSVFYSFAHKMYPKNLTPSHCHRFIRALEKRGKLLRNYTQNIDGLEEMCGITRAVQCHGSFATATCINCHLTASGDTIKDALFAQRIPLCPNCNTETVLRPKKVRRKKKKKKRNDGWESDEPEEVFPPLPPGIMKPDITFFGEKLPKSFDKTVFEDIVKADLLIVMGTSLKVRPVSEIISHLPHGVTTIVINKTPLSHIVSHYQLLGDADVVVKYLARCLPMNLNPVEGSTGDAANTLIPTNKSTEPSQVTRNRKKTKYKVIGKSGIFLFKGAEGGQYVEKKIAKRSTLGPDDGDRVKEFEMSESCSSDSDDGRRGNGSMAEGRSRKRPRRSL